jgi:hypothetical protein
LYVLRVEVINKDKENTLRRLARAAKINGSMAVGCLVTTLATGRTEYLAEFIHDLYDSFSHSKRYQIQRDADGKESDEQKKILRFVMGGAALLAIAHAIWQGWDAVNGQFVNDLNTTHNGEIDKIGLAVALGIAVGNTWAKIELDQINEQTYTIEHAVKHQNTDTLASNGFALVIGADALGLFDYTRINQPATWGGLFFSSYTALHLGREALRPHDHEH